MRGDVMFDDALRIADSPIKPAIDHPLAYGAEVNRKRMQVAARQWAAGKLNPKYNDKAPAQHLHIETHIAQERGSVIDELARRLERKANHLAHQQLSPPPPGVKGFPFSGDRGVGVVEAETGGGGDNPPLTLPSRTRSAPEPEILPPVKPGERELPPDLAVNPFLGRVVPFDETEIE